VNNTARGPQPWFLELAMLLPASIVFVFVALALNQGGSVDDAQFIRTKSLAVCRQLVKSYDAAHLEENSSTAYAFQETWKAECRVFVVSAHDRNV
jgi:hypothetical protein